MVLDILKGFLVGICASAPLGPIAIFVIQKSLSEGHKSGFIIKDMWREHKLISIFKMFRNKEVQ